MNRRESGTFKNAINSITTLTRCSKRIVHDPLMKRELAQQSGILSELTKNPVLDGALLKRLREESAGGGQSNIGRTARDPFS